MVSVRPSMRFTVQDQSSGVHAARSKPSTPAMAGSAQTASSRLFAADVMSGFHRDAARSTTTIRQAPTNQRRMPVDPWLTSAAVPLPGEFDARLVITAGDVTVELSIERANANRPVAHLACELDRDGRL